MAGQGTAHCVWHSLQLPSGIYPEVEFPRVVVVARHAGETADLLVTSTTRPLEAAVSTVPGLQRVRSKTVRGSTELSLQFVSGTDMWRAFQLVQARVAEVRSSLPEGSETTVQRVTTGSYPIATFNVTGPVDPRVLRERYLDRFGKFMRQYEDLFQSLEMTHRVVRTDCDPWTVLASFLLERKRMP